MTGPQVPYPNATASPAAVTTPTTATPPVGTQAPVASAMDAPVGTPPEGSAEPLLAWWHEATPEQQSAWQAAHITTGTAVTAGPGVTVNPDGTVTGSIADISKILQAGLQGTKAVDPTVAQGQNAYEHIWGVTPPKGYIEGLVKAGFNVFQIQLHELQMPGANRTQYYRDNLASMAAQIAQLMGRR